MRFLCVSDIHGHAEALTRVIAEGKSVGFDQLVACGDHLFPGPDPLETWKLLTSHRALCVQGISDRAVAELDPQKLQPETAEQQKRLTRLLEFHRELGELIIARLRKLPRLVRLPLENGTEMVIVHGAPADPSEALSSAMTDEEMFALMANESADLVVCGASHELFQRQLEGTRVLSVGSVGQSPGGGYATAALVNSTPLGTGIVELTVKL